MMTHSESERERGRSDHDRIHGVGLRESVDYDRTKIRSGSLIEESRVE